MSTAWLKKLEGLPLARLRATWVDFEELFPLEGMPLTDLCISGGLLENDDEDVTFSLEPLHDMSLTALRFITTNSTIYWDDGDLAVLHGMPLTVLDLGNNRFTDAGMEYLKGMPLTELGFSGVEFWEGNLVTNAGLEVLRGMPLTVLTLGGFVSISSAGLEVLRGMPLVSLDLSNTAVSDLGLENLKDMPLTSLNLSMCNEIIGYGFNYLKGLPLRVLKVEDCDELDFLYLAQFWQARFEAVVPAQV